jgi:hypothetical protein
MDKSQIKKFQELYYKEFGIKISESEAFKYGSDLIEIIKLTLQSK